MKLRTLGIATFFALGSPVAFAGGDHGAAEHKTMDADGDGKVSADEHATAARKMFTMMDGNRDDKVTADEMTAAQDKMHAGKDTNKDTNKDKKKGKAMSSADKIKVVDSDGDGVLTAEEHAAGSKMMFGKMDTDKDGFLTAAELDAGHARMMKGDK